MSRGWDEYGQQSALLHFLITVIPIMSIENWRNDPSAVLPPALLARPSVRRDSVFSDLITIFRRGSSYPNRLFRPLSRPSVSKPAKKKKEESEALSVANAQEQSQDEEPEEDGKPMSRQVLMDKIREKKEVIGKLRCQPWNMNRKRRTLRLAQKYVAQHESRVSKTHLLKVELKKKWHEFCRWANNVKIYLIPWEAKIKHIESHFGSVVSSYFTFLRWIVYINLVITLIIISFIVIPEMLADAAADPSRKNRTASRKIIPPRELIHADELQVVSNFDGYLKYSPLFYGYYSNDEFVGARVRMAMNARLSKMSDKKTDQYIFSWKLLSGWDYTIGNSETACNTAMAIVIKLRESIMECRVDTEKKFKPLLFLARVAANAIILAMLAFSIYTISFAVQTSETVEKTGSLFTKNQVPTIIATITNVFPMIFDLIGQIERYHPRTALRAHLTRVLVLYLLNYITFIIALFEKLDKIRDDELMKIINEQNVMFLSDEQQHLDQTKSLSRNFDNIKQANMFAETSLKRFSFQINEETKRRKRQAPKSKRLPERTTIESHYGPLGLNNPNALLVNKSYPWDERRFQAIRIGPPSLPTFPIPPLPPKPTMNTSILTEVGPYWDRRSKWQSPRTMILTTTPTLSEKSSRSSFLRTTRIPWSNKQKLKPVRRLKATYAPLVASDSEADQSLDDTSSGLKKETNTERVKDGMISESRTAATDTLISSESASPTITATSEELSRASTTTSESSTIKVSNPATSGIASVNSATPGKNSSALSTKTTVVSSRRVTSSSSSAPEIGNIPERQVNHTQIVHRFSNTSSSVKGTKQDLNTVVKQAPLSMRKFITTMDQMMEGIRKPEIRRSGILSNRSKKIDGNKLYLQVRNGARENGTLYKIGQKAPITAEEEAEMGNNFCWETMIGQPEYGEFKVAENVLHIINNQGMVWLGLFFAPLLPALNNLKLIILMYIRGWACMTCNVPAREIFRASRSSNFYLMVLLLWLLLCTLPVGYVIASKRPSSSCGPFAGYSRFYNVLTQVLEDRIDRKVISWLRYIASPGVVIPVLLLLMLIIYFLVSLVRGLRKTNNDLQQQLIHERTEEKKKIFELAGSAQRKISENNLEVKKQVTYLPLIEQKRREPWRFYNEVIANFFVLI
uniref:TMC domain-containing protein n=1 Tax=Setaria digitata TaxID=48799 RepID=A0A915PN15_9BILA